MRWRFELEPILVPEATGPQRQWIHHNASHGTVNAWSWPVATGSGSVYLYWRDLDTCARSPDRQLAFLLIPQGVEPQLVVPMRATIDETPWLLGYAGATDAEGVVVQLASGRWELVVADSSLEFEKREGESVLLLVEPWFVERVHFYGATRDGVRALEEEWRYGERSREMVAQRCRKRRPVGTRVREVERADLMPVDSFPEPVPVR